MRDIILQEREADSMEGIKAFSVNAWSVGPADLQPPITDGPKGDYESLATSLIPILLKTLCEVYVDCYMGRINDRRGLRLLREYYLMAHHIAYDSRCTTSPNDDRAADAPE
ncbi:hypothetical protein DFH06DRAFT_1147088 [Mycena polygramma]|nr:hypothetical protein DFH06DRAFT_1147088 [Mycena polygramma]